MLELRSFSSVTTLIDRSMVSGSKPVKTIFPVSNASGLSIAFLTVIAGNERIEDSSLIVPLSEMLD